METIKIKHASLDNLRRVSKKRKDNEHRLDIRIKTDSDTVTNNMNLLWACYNDWNQLNDKRQEHFRFMRYYDGNQWDDKVPDPDYPGRSITEHELISRTGVTPITHNIIQQYIRNVLGQMLTNNYKSVVNARRNEDSQAAEMMTNAIQACLEHNENATIDISNIIALHTMGIAFNKITYTKWDEDNESDARIDFISPSRIAWNQDCEDPRMLDIRRICELHSYTRQEVISNFARTSSDIKKIDELLYLMNNADTTIMEQNNNKAETVIPNMDFWGNSNETNKYRVIEVWSKRGRWVLWANDRASFECPKEYVDDIEEWEAKIAEENQYRIMLGTSNGMEEASIPIIESERHYEYYWYCQFLTPQGYSLLEMESPYEHGSHPYVFAAMPILDGTNKPLFSDLIEMQRNINRQRTILDMLIASSAKNTLFIPEESLDGIRLEDYADEIMKINGVVKYKARPGIPLPQFLQRNSINLGVFDILNYDMQQIQQISGLSGAVQGQIAKSGTPASLYAQQAQNTMLNFVLLFDRFNNYCIKRDRKLLRVILQYYTSPRYINVSGSNYGNTANEYIPEKAKALAGNYALVTSQGADTPVFRERINEYLMEMLRGGLIPIDMFLEHTTLPFGKQLLSELQSLRQQSQNGQINPDTLNNVQAMASQAAQEGRPNDAEPRAMQMIQQMISGKLSPAPPTAQSVS